MIRTVRGAVRSLGDAMTTEIHASTPSFSDRVAKFLDRVDIRRADTDEDREAVFRLRYDAYLREGAITPGLSKRVTDRFDDMANAWIFGVHLDGKLVSSLRLNVSLDICPDLPALQVFSDVLAERIEAGETIVDPTRFVADAASSRLYPELPYMTLRLGWVATQYFEADLVLAAVRAEHQAFYKRVFGHRPVCAPRPYPNLEKPISLMALDPRAAREQVHRRYPFFRSTFFERRMLFERPMPPRHSADFLPLMTIGAAHDALVAAG